MTETQETILLPKGQEIITMDPGIFYRLQSGQVSVFIVPVANNKRGRPVLVRTVSVNDRIRTVPSFAAEADGKLWFLSIVSDAEDTALVKGEGVTVPLRMNFLRSAQLPTDGGFEKALLDHHTSCALPSRKITVRNTEPYLTEDPNTAYRLESGRIYVDVVAIKRGRAAESAFYCQLEPGAMFPSLDHRNVDHTKYRLRIRSVDDGAVLTALPEAATPELRRSFLELNGCRDHEGYEIGLVEYFIRQRLNPIHKEEKEAFDSRIYKALQFLCPKLGIDLIGEEDLKARCDGDPEIGDIARMSHFICRRIVLEPDWYRQDCGGLIGTLDNSEEDGQAAKPADRRPKKEIVACVPDKKGRYILYHSSDGTTEPLTEALAHRIVPNAWSLGRTLPQRQLTKKDVFRFCAKSLHFRDLIPYMILAIIGTLIGVLLPKLNGLIYDEYIPVGDIGNMVEICLLILSFTAGNLAFSIVKNLFGFRMTSRLRNDIQNAAYHRLFHLPESFFRKYESADMAERVSAVGEMASRYANTLILNGLSALFSVFYLIQMFRYSSKLAWVGLAIYGIYLTFSVVITLSSRKGQLRIAEANADAGSKLYQYLNGVDKIRMAGVENRALRSYMKPYTKAQMEAIRLNRLVSVEEALSSVISSVFSMVLYWVIARKLGSDGFTVGAFMAFNGAFGAFTGALGSLVGETLDLLQAKSAVDRFWPIFDTAPEDDASKEVLGTLSGDLALEDVYFSYGGDSKPVLKDMSLRIRRGEYVGIVGPSGCGKSTLLKLLLGFETPQRGRVLVNGRDLRTLNKGSYRRQLGVVLQNGQLISGSIYDNITVTAPGAKMSRVNEVIGQVGLKDDIAQMPMGLHTMLGENCNTISGGQKQRILIARAICGSPKILLFDEATSALDNLTQAAVSSNLDKMNITRIVVAHRLSTIKNCDRIIVLEDGAIVQEGNYDTLMQDTGGLFYRLATRQIAQ